ncbi:hypothetical protein GN244_ATG14037 [Phytophthora infestans]|uniref:Uncharacterized protein n=1 Tax=Phytophthora infestans TaxID=4787 RepID=A0A833W8P9_PHYIN|nr:hypothetical protein GN244_ATG14037 [Phytophthora infestans]
MEATATTTVSGNDYYGHGNDYYPDYYSSYGGGNAQRLLPDYYSSYNGGYGNGNGYYGTTTLPTATQVTAATATPTSGTRATLGMSRPQQVSVLLVARKRVCDCEWSEGVCDCVYGRCRRQVGQKSKTESKASKETKSDATDKSKDK